MRRAYAVLGWGIVILGLLHMVSTPRHLTSAAVWFFSGGIAMVLTGGLNLLNRAYGTGAPGLRWFCIGTNAIMTVFALVAGYVGRGGVAALIVIGAWLGATTIMSALQSTTRSALPHPASQPL